VDTKFLVGLGIRRAVRRIVLLVLAILSNEQRLREVPYPNRKPSNQHSEDNPASKLLGSSGLGFSFPRRFSFLQILASLPQNSFSRLPTTSPSDNIHRHILPHFIHNPLPFIPLTVDPNYRASPQQLWRPLTPLSLLGQIPLK
jgi:hypothetical protein